jgi:hypothetical protein
MTPDNMNNMKSILVNITSIGQGAYSEAAYIAQKTVEYSNSLTAKEINKAEYADLMADLKVDQMVANTAEEQEIKTALQAYMNEILILVASIPVF